MITVGIAGQIGCGKSLVAEVFAQLGALVISGDELGREVVDRNPRLLKEIVQSFGGEILTKTQRLDRARLGRLVFEDVASTALLNKLVHPWLLKELRKRILQAGKTKKWKVLVVDAALIYNWRLEQELDYSVVVESTYRHQKARLQARGLTERDIRNRIRRQIPKYLQRRQADFVILNNGSRKELTARAARLYERIVRLADKV